jgi:DNA-binding MarR family transcriptional regulator
MAPDALPELSDRLRTTTARLARRLRQQGNSGYGPTFNGTLVMVGKHGPISLGDLAAHEHVAPPTMTRVVDRMEAVGFVARFPDPHDGRIRLVSITPAGTAHLRTTRRLRTEWLVERMATLSDDQREDLAAAIPVLEALVDDDPSHEPAPPA